MERDKTQKLIGFGLILLLIFGIGLQLYFVYFGYIYYRYLVPPGGDVVNHYLIIENIIKNGSIFNAGYPTLFHLLTIWISRPFNTDIFYVLTYWTPILTILPAFAIYFFLRQLFDRKVSVIASLIFVLTSQYPLYAFVDGNYPDMLAYGCFSIFLFGFIIRFYKTHKIVNLIIALAFLPFIALTHHFTFVSILTILVVFGIIQLFCLIDEKKFNLNWKTVLFGILMLICLFLSVFIANKIYGQTASGFIGGLVNNKAYLTDAYLNKPLSYGEYPIILGKMSWYLGLIGLLLVIITSYMNREKNKAKQLIIIWFLYFLIMSRIGATGLPARFARELIPPLIICIGFLLDQFFNSNYLKSRIGIYFGYGLIGFMIVMNSALYTGILQLPEGYQNMVWYTDVDQKKVDYLAENIDYQEDVLYNAKANIFTPVKTENKLILFSLGPEELTTVKNYQKNEAFQEDFDLLVKSKKIDFYNIKYIFIDKKPSSNPDEKAYPPYANYHENNAVLEEMAKDGELIKKFADGAKLIKVDFEKFDPKKEVKSQYKYNEKRNYQ